MGVQPATSPRPSGSGYLHAHVPMDMAGGNAEFPSDGLSGLPGRPSGRIDVPGASSPLAEDRATLAVLTGASVGRLRRILGEIADGGALLARCRPANTVIGP